MLGYWRCHADYQIWLKSKLNSLLSSHKSHIIFYRSLIEKLYVINLDSLKEIIAPLYARTGRPANYQPEILRVYLSTQNSPMWLLKIPPLNNKSYAFIELSTVFYVISLIVTMQSMIVSI